MKKFYTISILTVWFYLCMCVIVSAQAPADTAGMQLFVRSDSLGKTYAADAAIDSIKNLGNRGGWFTQGTAANRPLFRSSVSQTGEPGIDFDGSNDTMTMPSSTTLFNAFHNGSQFTLVVVFTLDALGATHMILQNSNNSDTNVGFALYGGSDNRIYFRMARGTTQQPTFHVPTPDVVVSTGVVHFLTITHNDSRSPNLLFRMDTLDRATSEDIYVHSASNASQNLALTRSTLPLNGKILEIRGYNVSKSVAQVRAIETEIISRYYSSFTPLAMADRKTKPRTFFAPTSTWADSLIRAYAFTPEDSVRVDSVKDWSAQNAWAVEFDAPFGGPGNYWCNELGESPGLNIGGRQDRRLLAGSVEGLGITDQLTVAMRVRLTKLNFGGFGFAMSFYASGSPTTSRIDFNEISYGTGNFLVNTGTGTNSSFGTIGIAMQYVTLIGTYAGDSIRTYVDGVKISATAKTGNISIPAGTIMAIGARGTSFYIGNALMTCVWKRVLTAAEIAQITANPYIMFAGSTGKRFLVQSILPEIFIKYWLYTLIAILVAGTGLGVYRHFFYKTIKRW